MEDDFFLDQSSGDPVWMQHYFWFFGHPEVWLWIVMWIILFFAIVKLARRLWKSGEKLWLAALLFSSTSFVSAYGWFSKSAHAVYVVGRSDQVLALEYLQYALIFLSVLSIAWLIFDRKKIPNR